MLLVRVGILDLGIGMVPRLPPGAGDARRLNTGETPGMFAVALLLRSGAFAIEGRFFLERGSYVSYRSAGVGVCLLRG